MVRRLKQEHASLTQLWEILLEDLGKPAALTKNPEFEAHVEQFCSAYRAHIDFENRELLDMAQHILSQRQLEEMGRAMARRRSAGR